MNNNIPIDSHHTCTVADMAGCCHEWAAWRMLRDLSAQLATQQPPLHLSPAAIAVSMEGGFSLMEPLAKDANPVYDAPECQNADPTPAGMVWSLAATLFYAVMGCNVMNGKGGAAQQPESRLPYMRSEMPDLSVLLQRCLDFYPDRRPAWADLQAEAEAHLNLWGDILRQGPRLRPRLATGGGGDGRQTDSWPEEMVSL